MVPALTGPQLVRCAYLRLSGPDVERLHPITDVNLVTTMDLPPLSRWGRRAGCSTVKERLGVREEEGGGPKGRFLGANRQRILEPCGSRRPSMSRVVEGQSEPPLVSSRNVGLGPPPWSGERAMVSGWTLPGPPTWRFLRGFLGRTFPLAPRRNPCGDTATADPGVTSSHEEAWLPPPSSTMRCRKQASRSVVGPSLGISDRLSRRGDLLRQPAQTGPARAPSPSIRRSPRAPLRAPSRRRHKDELMNKLRGTISLQRRLSSVPCMHAPFGLLGPGPWSTSRISSTT